MPSASALAVVALAVFLGALVNALSGFGFALVTVPLMTLALGPKQAVVVSALVGIVSNSTVLWRNRSAVQRRVAGRLLAGSLIGMPVGVLVLTRVADAPLQVAIAVVVLGAVVLYATGRGPTATTPAAEVFAGAISGAFNTSIGISGPPVVLTLNAAGLPKDRFRATSVAVFALAGVGALVLFGVAGRYERAVFAAALVALPALPVGLWVGDRLHLGMSQERFASLVLVLLGATAVVTLVNALVG